MVYRLSFLLQRLLGVNFGTKVFGQFFDIPLSDIVEQKTSPFSSRAVSSNELSKARDMVNRTVVDFGFAQFDSCRTAEARLNHYVHVPVRICLLSNSETRHR